MACYMRNNLNFEKKKYQEKLERDSAASLLTKQQKLLIKIVLSKYELHLAVKRFKFDELTYPQFFKTTIRKKTKGSIENQVRKLTKKWNVTVNIDLFMQFIQCYGFVPSDGRGFAGLPIFMITPKHSTMSDEQRMEMCRYIAVDNSASNNAKRLHNTDYYIPKNEEKSIKMFSGGSRFLKKMSDGRPNLVSTGYNKALNCMQDKLYSNAINEASWGNLPHFFAKLLWQIDFINQHLFKEIDWAIDVALAANMGAIVVPEEWITTRNNSIKEYFEAIRDHRNPYTMPRGVSELLNPVPEDPGNDVQPKPRDRKQRAKDDPKRERGYK